MAEMMNPGAGRRHLIVPTGIFYTAYALYGRGG